MSRVLSGAIRGYQGFYKGYHDHDYSRERERDRERERERVKKALI